MTKTVRARCFPPDNARPEPRTVRAGKHKRTPHAVHAPRGTGAVPPPGLLTCFARTRRAALACAAQAANILFAWWSHDIGGFRGNPGPEAYARWAQFGALSQWGKRLTHTHKNKRALACFRSLACLVCWLVF